MKRLFDNVLKEWRQQPRRKPLIVRGARQVGKTYSINAFGKSAFDDLVVFDFEANRRLQRVFADNLDARDLVTQLEAEAESKIVPGQTLVFFDEIQACPRALTALRFLRPLRRTASTPASVSVARLVRPALPPPRDEQA